MPQIAMATSSVAETDEEASTTRVDDLIQRGRSQGHLSLAELRNAFDQAGMTPAEGRSILRELAESSPSIVTPLNSAIGYEEAAAVAKQALKERKTIRQTVIDRGLIGDKLSEEELDRRLDVLAMTKVNDEPT